MGPDDKDVIDITDQTVGMGLPWFCISSKKFSSILLMNILAKVGAHFVPIATPCICLYVVR